MKTFLLFTISLSLLAAAEPASDRLDAEVSRLAKISGGSVGVSALHVESNRRYTFHADDRYPMASTYKVPIAVQLLARVDRGEIRLDQMVNLEQHDLHPGSGTLTDLFSTPGVSLSVLNLLDLMLLISDNTAADLCMRLAGGPAAVTAKMREIGITGIDISRPTANLIADKAGLTLPPESEWTPERLHELLEATTPEQRKQADDRFSQDTRDTAQPNAMAALLEKIYRRELHKPETADLLLNIMYHCRTGDARIKGMLPPGTEVAHKTGTLNGTVDDVGVITLPDDAGHIILAAFVTHASTNEAGEKTIAQISRAIYDYFLFTRAQQ